MKTVAFARGLFAYSISVAIFFFATLPAAISLGENPTANDPTARPAAAQISEKYAILNSPEWRQAIFALGSWLDSQTIYPAAEVASIKSNFNRRVQEMSATELRYLLDDLQQKMAIMNTPEALEARSWVGHYLAIASDARRAEIMKDVPDLTTMTAAELATEIRAIEAKRQQLESNQSVFNDSQRQLVRIQQQNISSTQTAIAAAKRQPMSSYSPYRGPQGGQGKTPYANVKTGGSVHVGVGPFGAYVSF